MKKIPVMLTIRGEQHYRGQEPDMVELMTEGELEETPEGWRICYLESDLTGLEGATTTFDIHDRVNYSVKKSQLKINDDIRPGYVVLSRTGAVQSQMVFQEGVRHESLYQLDIGALMVCVCARKIHVNLGPLGGNLDVFYSIEVEQTMAGTVRYQIAVRPV
jgi:hypothetical protein